MSREAVIESLAPLFERADRERLWFYFSYQGMWFSPDELRAKHAAGRLYFGAVNWTLRNPNELHAECVGSVQSALRRLESVDARLEKWEASAT